jgi:putative membrane protein
MLAVLRTALGLQAVEPLALYLFAILAAIVFAAILQFLSATFGPAGKLLSVALLMLQLTSAAGTFPIQTAPRFFQTLSPWLPMTYVVAGMRQAISGGDLRVLAGCAAALAAFGLLAICGTTLTAARRRVWTMDRLRPRLEL